MAENITMTYGSTVLTIRPAEYSDRREIRRTQVRSRTHDGQLVVGDKGLTIVRFILSWNALTKAKRDEVEVFFGPDVVNGSLNTFVYFDHFLVSNTVRLLTDVVSYQNVFDDFWTVDLELEVVSEDAGS